MDHVDPNERTRTIDDDRRPVDDDLHPIEGDRQPLEGDRQPIDDGPAVTRDAASSPVGGVDVEARWQVTQSQFLESPREAVAAADQLVSDVVEDLRRRLDAERTEVAEGWRHEGAETEELRRAMLRYREVLDRLLAQAS